VEGVSRGDMMWLCTPIYLVTLEDYLLIYITKNTSPFQAACRHVIHDVVSSDSSCRNIHMNIQAQNKSKSNGAASWGVKRGKLQERAHTCPN
jgi:hypothetical protein